MTRVLVAGGAGYIGSHTVRALLAGGHEVVVIDNLSSGHRRALPPDVPLLEIDLADQAAITDALRNHRPEVVVHLAGAIEAGQSMVNPRRFFTENVINLQHVLDAMLDAGVSRIVFSSSAAVYGEPERLPITEAAGCAPTNVYGLTKLIGEQMLAAYHRAYGLRATSLRYFNACGAAADASIGPDHRHKTHLISVAMQAAVGHADHIDVYGTDYPTPDGTCIRDYVHVDDLAGAHVLAVEAIDSGDGVGIFNLGTGRGTSVLEVLDAVDRVLGRPIPRRLVARRDGDPAALACDSSLFASTFEWSPRYRDIEEIIATAWAFQLEHPTGFSD